MYIRTFINPVRRSKFKCILITEPCSWNISSSMSSVTSSFILLTNRTQPCVAVTSIDNANNKTFGSCVCS